MSKLRFIIEAIRHPFVTGDILPTGKYLVREMLKSIESYKSPLRIIEFGGGEGALTAAIVEKLENSRIDYSFLSFEINPRFVEANRERFLNNGELRGSVHIIEDNVENTIKYLTDGRYGMSEADYVISSLPLSHFSNRKTLEVLNTAKKGLRNGGVFTQYQHFRTRLNVVRDIFPDIRVSFVPWNFPPAFVYTCKKRE